MITGSTPHSLWQPGTTVALGAAALLLAGCAPTPAAPAAPGPAPAPATAPAAPAPLAPKKGGVLVYAPIKPTTSLHPYVGASDVDFLRGVGPAYETLISFKYETGKDWREAMEVVPWLAESWELPDKTTYVFHLRQGIKWHDGEELTAQDVVKTYTWMQDPKVGVRKREQVAPAQSIEALDKYTVRITTKAPSALFLQNLANDNLFILPARHLDGGTDFNKTVMGTGPFKLKSFTANKETVWEPHAAYWQEGRPYLDGIKAIWGLDNAAMQAAFRTSQNDLVAFEDKAQFDAFVKTKPETLYLKTLTETGNAFYPKVDRPPFDDLRVRRALHIAVDREAMVKTLTFGLGAANLPFVPGWMKAWAIPDEEVARTPGYRQPKDQDVAEARRLLQEAGLGSGFRIKMTYNSGSPLPRNIAEMLPEQARKVNIELQLDPQEAGAFSKIDAEGSFDALLTGDLSRSDLPGKIGERLHSKGRVNNLGVKDEKLDRMLDAFPSHFDEKERKQKALEIQRYLLEQLYGIPTIEFASFIAWQPWVNGYVHRGGVAVIVAQHSVSRLWLETDKVPQGR